MTAQPQAAAQAGGWARKPAPVGKKAANACRRQPSHLEFCKAGMLVPEHQGQPLPLDQRAYAGVCLKGRHVAGQHVQQGQRKAQRSVILVAPRQKARRLAGVHHGVVKVGQRAEHGGQAGGGVTRRIGGRGAQRRGQLRLEVDAARPARANGGGGAAGWGRSGCGITAATSRSQLTCFATPE